MVAEFKNYKEWCVKMKLNPNKQENLKLYLKEQKSNNELQVIEDEGTLEVEGV